MNRLLEQAGAICLMLVLSIAAAFGLGFVFIGGGEWILTAWAARADNERPQIYEYVEVSADGEAYIRRGQLSPPGDMAYYDLKRNEISPSEATSYGTLTNLPAVSHDRRPDSSSVGYRPRVSDRVISVAKVVRGREEWFLVASRDGTRAFFEGFDVLTNQRVGAIGAKGFSEGQLSEDEWFDISGSPVTRYVLGRAATGRNRAYVLSDRLVSMIDFETRSVQSLVEGAITMANTNRFVEGRITHQQSDQLAVRLEESIRVYDEQGELAATFPIPPALRDMDIRFHNLGDEALLVGATPAHLLMRDSDWPYVYDWDHVVARATADGRIVSEHAVTLSHRRREVGSLHEVLGAGVPALAWILGIAGPISAAQKRDWGRAESFGDAYLAFLADAWLPLMIILLVTGVCLWLTLRHHRRHPESHLGAALGLVAVLGLPGYIAYRLHRPWPKPQTIPPIERTGVEIFA